MGQISYDVGGYHFPKESAAAPAKIQEEDAIKQRVDDLRKEFLDSKLDIFCLQDLSTKELKAFYNEQVNKQYRCVYLDNREGQNCIAILFKDAKFKLLDAGDGPVNEGIAERKEIPLLPVASPSGGGLPTHITIELQDKEKKDVTVRVANCSMAIYGGTTGDTKTETRVVNLLNSVEKEAKQNQVRIIAGNFIGGGGGGLLRRIIEKQYKQIEGEQDFKHQPEQIFGKSIKYESQFSENRSQNLSGFVVSRLTVFEGPVQQAEQAQKEAVSTPSVSPTTPAPAAIAPKNIGFNQAGKNLASRAWRSPLYRFFSMITLGLLPLLTYLFGGVFFRQTKPTT